MMASGPRKGILSVGIAMGIALGSGCCALHEGSCGGGDLLALFHPPAWYGECNECGPTPVAACGQGCGPGGVIPWVRRQLVCGHGCGEIYLGEWISDPPDCADPCDTCYGQWTGQGGVCRLGPFQRILAGLHGYRYCPPPYCGPWCPIFPRHGWRACGPGLPCGNCGKAGCAACGFGLPGDAVLHGGEIDEEGLAAPSSAPFDAGEAETLPPGGTSILDENWDIPRARPEPGKPVHEARPPARPSLGGRGPAQMSHLVTAPPASRAASSAGGAARSAPRPAPPRTAVGSGVSPAGWTR
jgi:hypothetical protein